MEERHPVAHDRLRQQAFSLKICSTLALRITADRLPEPTLSMLTAPLTGSKLSIIFSFFIRAVIHRLTHFPEPRRVTCGDGLDWSAWRSLVYLHALGKRRHQQKIFASSPKTAPLAGRSGVQMRSSRSTKRMT